MRHRQHRTKSAKRYTTKKQQQTQYKGIMLWLGGVAIFLLLVFIGYLNYYQQFAILKNWLTTPQKVTMQHEIQFDFYSELSNDEE